MNLKFNSLPMNLHASNENLYNNADSFAMAFDAAWNDDDLGNDKDKKTEEKIQITLKKIETHPFLVENPIQAKNIALFRIKLLGLS
tara:strand:+ start:2267 stop:2524 length:258 start_codon:yes stop_codon:yes gene_type:complete